jgi:hypothetical protein
MNALIRFVLTGVLGLLATGCLTMPAVGPSTGETFATVDITLSG